jgi:hypothetical protein
MRTFFVGICIFFLLLLGLIAFAVRATVMKQAPGELNPKAAVAHSVNVAHTRGLSYRI